jgi:hypothetical protein
MGITYIILDLMVIADKTLELGTWRHIWDFHGSEYSSRGIVGCEAV